MNEGETKKGRQVTRREMVEKLLAAMAAGITWPLIASSHPIHQHVKDGATLERADAAQKAVAWQALFFNEQQNEMVITLAECIVPGSTAARVNRFIDLLLSVDTSENQRKFVAALAVIDSESQQRFSGTFHRLTASEQALLLTSVSAEGASKEHFDRLKDWITVAYYSSEEGMRELGWTANRTFRTFPGCEHADEAH